MTRVFIDGSAGTTGLRIHERLASRNDIELVILSEETRKDEKARKEAINSSDVAFLCLPDQAADETMSLVESKNVCIIDTSTIHRTQAGWTYGFPELEGFYEKIKQSKRIANPGCFASGFVSLVKPLVSNGIIKKDAMLSCFAITGYSGGGKKMIAQYQEKKDDLYFSAPRMYALTQSHKHLPEMKLITGLENAPAFCPVVAPFYSGMQVTVPLFGKEITSDIEAIKQIYKEYYKPDGLVYFEEKADEEGYMSSAKFSGRDDMEITVCGNENRILLVSRFDNLGKGASGSAIQNMNIVLGNNMKTGLSYQEAVK